MTHLTKKISTLQAKFLVIFRLTFPFGGRNIISDMKTYDREQVIELLRKRKGSTPLARFAVEIGVKPLYLSQILAGYRNPGIRVLKYLGLGKEKTVKVSYFEMNGAKR